MHVRELDAHHRGQAVPLALPRLEHHPRRRAAAVLLPGRREEPLEPLADLLRIESPVCVPVPGIEPPLAQLAELGRGEGLAAASAWSRPSRITAGVRNIPCPNPDMSKGYLPPSGSLAAQRSGVKRKSSVQAFPASKRSDAFAGSPSPGRTSPPLATSAIATEEIMTSRMTGTTATRTDSRSSIRTPLMFLKPPDPSVTARLVIEGMRRSAIGTARKVSRGGRGPRTRSPGPTSGRPGRGLASGRRRGVGAGDGDARLFAIDPRPTPRCRLRHPPPRSGQALLPETRKRQPRMDRLRVGEVPTYGRFWNNTENFPTNSSSIDTRTIAAILSRSPDVPTIDERAPKPRHRCERP